MNRILHYIPEITPIELNYLTQVTSKMNEESFDYFIMQYVTRRHSQATVLILCLIGLLGVGGIHRFMLGHIGLGILYILTVGLCYIGTVVDAINYKTLTAEANIKIANDLLMMIERSNH